MTMEMLFGGLMILTMVAVIVVTMTSTRNSDSRGGEYDLRKGNRGRRSNNRK